MFKNFKKRFYTSLVLLIILTFMILNEYILGFILMISGILATLEFFQISSIIFAKKKIKQSLFNILFTIFIFLFCTSFFIISNYSNLKIILFLILLLCIASDIGGFIFGKILKGPKLTKISPNKTISGSIGSIIFSIATGLGVIYYFTKNFDLIIVLVAIATSIFCQIGDLLFSILKRKSLLKDTGNFLPGHGGILDRVDGILIGVPMGFLTLIIIN